MIETHEVDWMMAAAAESDDQIQNGEAQKSSKLGLILSVALCFLGAGLGYVGVSTGVIPIGGGEKTSPGPTQSVEERPDIAFVPIPTLIVTLPPDAKNDHLRFSGQIEVPAEYKSDVEFLLPRIQDLMNGYLRALTAEDIEGVGALFKIRLHLFRRIVMVVGLGKANGLMVTEFILN
ncbi:flagellar basal body-associated protein FliL [Marivita sp. S2033]|uniref:flagellar basal body-associated FliL family protein n=1 Tax=Marivita sp. S2033 TaxID=3373187 RepID=UPI0039822020